jgi:YVTN family beta-propeller protein
LSALAIVLGVALRLELNGQEVDMARILITALIAALATALGVAPAQAQNAYITNSGSNTVSVIATASNSVISIVPVGNTPLGVAVTPNGGTVYVANDGSNSVSAISTASNTVTGTISVGNIPEAVAATPDGSKVYVANYGGASVSVIATATNTIVGSPITVGSNPIGLAVTPDGSKVYVANFVSNNVSAIATATNTVIGGPIAVGSAPIGVAATPNGSSVYVANQGSNNVSVIATASNTVTATIPVASGPTGVAVTPDGSKVYVTSASGGVSVIATTTNTVIAGPIAVGSNPDGLAVSPDGSKVYVANNGSNNVSVIATASNTVTGTIAVGSSPVAQGIFIGPPTLTVAEAGSGSGQVTSSPTGINCSASSPQCAAMFPDGTQVTLTASATTGSSFAGWSGGGCSGTGTCVITPTADTTVTATFTVIPSFMLSVMTAGSGTVASSPPGIDCVSNGNTCSAVYESGTVVSLTQSTGQSFTGWGGACSGIGTCIITMNAAESASASFVPGSPPSTPLLAAVLPQSRSAVVNNPVTAFATILNTGSSTVPGCAIAPIGDPSLSFTYQTTNPTTNALTGTPNTPINIAAATNSGPGSQTFVIALTPGATFAPEQQQFAFACTNIYEAPIQNGVDTLLLSSSSSAVPDIVALAATASNDGILHIPNGSNAFAVATVNVGASSSITASANTGSATLPLALAICQTNPSTGVCMSAPGPNVVVTINANATPTFGIFGTASGSIAFNPANSRVFVQFVDSSGAVRGLTSVAVETQ